MLEESSERGQSFQSSVSAERGTAVGPCWYRPRPPEIDLNAPRARCATAHFCVLVLVAVFAHAGGSPRSADAFSVALLGAMSLGPLLPHLGPEDGPFLLNTRRAAIDLTRPQCAPARRTGAACRRVPARVRRRQGAVVAPLRPFRCLPHGYGVLLSSRAGPLRMPAPWSRWGRMRPPRRRTRRARRARRAARRSRACATHLSPCQPASALTTSC